MSDLLLKSSDDPAFAGTWHPFPPPDVGFYDLRQAVPGPDGDPQQYFFYFENKRVHITGRQGRLYCMGRRVIKMLPSQGWQFRFRRSKDGKQYRPIAVIYGSSPTPGLLQVLRKDDISNQLPVAVCREEALHIIRQIPERWPLFRMIHVEYTPETLS